MRMLISAEKGEETDDIPDSPPPLENDADYAIRTWLEHRMHHVYPAAGGYDDQSESLMRDWGVLNLYYLRAEKGVFTAMPAPASAGSWLDLMGD